MRVQSGPPWARRETRARFDPNSKGHFHRTRNKCKREYVLLEAELHAIAIRKIQFGLPKSGNTKVVPRKTVYRHAHVDHQQGLGTLFSVIRQTPK